MMAQLAPQIDALNDACVETTEASVVHTTVCKRYAKFRVLQLFRWVVHQLHVKR